MQRSDWWCLGCLAILALILRLIGLDSALWYDEIVTLVDFVRLPVHELVTAYHSLNNHILYSLSAKCSIAVLGESAWALRLPAALFGVASIVALWWLAIQVVGRAEAYLVCLMMTCSYHHIWFSQNARGYTGLLFFAIIATVCFFKGIRKTAMRWWVAYAVCMALSMYMHLSAGFVFASHGVVYVAMLIKQWCGRAMARGEGVLEWRPMVGFGLGAALTLVLYAVLVPQIIDEVTAVSATGPENSVRHWKSPLWTILEAAQSVFRYGVVVWLGVPAAILLLGVGGISLLRRQALLTSLMAVHFPLTMLLLIAISFRIWPRYFFVNLGFAVLVLVHGTYVSVEYVARRLQWDRRRPSIGRRLGTVVTAMLILATLVLLPRNYRFPKQDFQGARDYVESARAPGDVVAAVGLAATAYQKYYSPEWEVVSTRERLVELAAASGHVWLVYSFPAHTAAKFPGIIAKVKSDFDCLRVFPGTLGDGAVFVYRSR